MSFAVRAADHPRYAASGSTIERPTSAAVRSYICLYTHDLKRKQKRWQDGKLKYHTFNRRVMVYDDRGGFVGDAHWQGEQDLEDGEELQLDRGSAIVQVCDFTGEQQQDLTEILDKRAQEVEKRRVNAAARTGGPTSQQSMRTPAPSYRTSIEQPQTATRPTTGISEASRPHFQRLHRPLSAIVPSPGPIGRAVVPGHSPYEARRAEQEQREGEEPSSKRRRLSASPPSSSKSAFATRLFGAKLTLNGTASASAARKKALQDATNVKAGAEVEVRNLGTPLRPEHEGDDGDLVITECRSRSEGRPQFTTPRPMEPGAARPMSMAPVSRLREPRYPEPRYPEPRYPEPRATGPARNIDKSARETSLDHTELEQLPTRRTRDRSTEDSDDMHTARGTKQDQPSKPAKTKKLAQTQDRRRGQGRALQDEDPVEVDIIEVDRPERQPVVPTRAALHLSRSTTTKQKTPKEVPVEETTAPKELRTELRIKPRRKRGLLMVSEKAARTNDTPETRDKLSEPSRTTLSQDSRKALAQASSPKTCPVPVLEAPNVEEVPTSPPTMEASDVEEVPQSPPSQDTGFRGGSNEKITTGDASPEEDNHVLETESEKLSDDEKDAVSTPQGTGRSRRGPAEGKDRKESLKQRASPSDDEDEDAHLFAPRRRGARKRLADRGESEAEDDTGDRVELDDKSNRPPRNVNEDSSEEEVPTKRRTRQRTTSKKPAREDVSSDDAKIQPRSNRRSERQRKSHADDFPFSEEEESDSEPAPKRAATKRKAQEKPKQSGPRIERMARKSVKSREIFGFKMPGMMSMVPTAMVSAVGPIRQVVQPEPVAPVVATTVAEKPAVQAAAMEQQTNPANDAPDPREEAPVKAVVPRIANPATRGKKAARKEDAAGLAPQVFVPMDNPVAPMPPMPSRRPAMASEAATAAAAKTAALPGFSTASGGTWSKHAEDLLGMTRPGGPRRA